MAITSAATGSWGTGATWVGGVAPIAGDAVIILASHTITISGSQACAGITAAGPIIQAASSTLTSTGDILVDNTTYTIAAGSTLNFNHATTNLKLQLGTNHYQNSQLITTGSSGSHVTIASTGAAKAYITSGGFIAGGQVDLQYTDFNSMGDGSIPAWECYPYYASEHRFDHCVFTGGGTLKLAGYPFYDTILSLSHVSTVSTVASNAYEFMFYHAGGGGIRLIDNCAFDKTGTLFNPLQTTVSNTVFNGIPVGSIAGVSTLFDGNLIVGDQWVFNSGNVTNCYILMTSASNPHGLSLGGGSASVTDCVFEGTALTGTSGDCIVGDVAPSYPSTYTVTRNIFLPNAGGYPTGTAISCLGNSNFTWVFEHNTYHVSNSTTAGLSIGETYNGHPGMVSSCKSNLAFSTSDTGYIVSLLGSPVDGYVTAADHNGSTVITGGDYYEPANSKFAVVPGTGDVYGDPGFVAPTRTMLTWDTALGGPGTYAHALAELSKLNSPGYNSAYAIGPLLTYIRDGFVPTTSAFHAAHDSSVSGWIGAIAGTATPPATPWAGGVNFRATATYISSPASVADGPTTDYNLSDYTTGPEEFPNFDFSTPRIATVRQGWLNHGGVKVYTSFNINNALDVRLAGEAYITNTGDQRDFRFELPSAGTYRMRLALGTGSGSRQYCQILDTYSVLTTIDVTTTAGMIVDAGGTIFTPAAWPGNNVALMLTFATRNVTVRLGTPGADADATAIRHISFELVTPNPHRWNDYAGHADWEYVLLYGGLHMRRLMVVANALQDASYPVDLLGTFAYYDPIETFINIYTYTGDASWLTFIPETTLHHNWNVHQREYLAAAPFSGGTTEALLHTSGVLAEYQVLGDTTAQTILHNLTLYGWTDPANYPPNPQTLGPWGNFWIMRAAAYALRAMVHDEKAGAGTGRRAHMDFIVSHWCGAGGPVEGLLHYTDRASNQPGVWYINPLYIGVFMTSLAEYASWTGNYTVPMATIRLLCDFLWDNIYDANYGGMGFNHFMYDPDVPVWPAPLVWGPFGTNDHSNGSPDLAMIVAPGYMWMYLQTGETIFKTRAELLVTNNMFNSSGTWKNIMLLTLPYGAGTKQWNQMVKESFQYYGWLDQAEGGSGGGGGGGTTGHPRGIGRGRGL